MFCRILSIAIVTLLTATNAPAEHHTTPSGEGAFMTVTVQTDDAKAYRDFLKANPKAFEASGADAGGICIVKSGQRFPGEAFFWAAYPSLEKALSTIKTLEHGKATPKIKKLRTIKYVAAWKPLIPFTLAPAFERVQRVKIAPENVNAYREGIAKLEADINKGGHPDYEMGMFQAIGGGPEEAGIFMIRGISPSGATYGQLADEYYVGAPWAASNFQSVGGDDCPRWRQWCKTR
jgi:hypothetical protein